MIEYLKLTNFKRHENLEVELGDGLTVLAGANEAGKSSVLHAILYVMYGSRALPRSLDGTVTYGKPVASLRVDMRIRLSGVTYTLYRAKSGAELSGGGMLVSGAAEVTAAMERLLGVPAATAAKLLIANQGSLRGVVEEGSAAVKLIEELAQLDVIETLVEKVQTQLPTGSTSALLVQANSLDLSEPVLAVVDVAGPAAASETAEAAVAVAAEQLQTLTAQAEEAKVSATAHAQWKREVARLQAILDAPRTPDTVRTVTDIGQLQTAKAKAAADKLTRQAWAAFQMLTPVANPGPAPAVDHKAVPTLQMELQAARARRINDESCGLCGKLLQDVPEVVSGNAAVDAKVAELQARLHTALAEEAAQTTTLALWTRAQKEYQAFQLGLARLSDYVRDGAWVGGDVASEVDRTDYDALIAAEMEKQRRAAAVAERMRREEADRKAALAALAALVEPVLLPPVETEGAKQALRVARSQAFAAAEALAAASVAAAGAAARFEAQIQAHAAAVTRKVELLATVSSMDANNALVKKLRLARPEIASKLWGGLLQAISQTFSTLRGVASVVTRDADGFAVDGKPVADLSGSTLDVLGLAVRVALLRAFLPGVGLLILDEPAAAMDAERENTLLGTLVSLGLEQVLMVSHSDAAKAVAKEVVLLG